MRLLNFTLATLLFINCKDVFGTIQYNNISSLLNNYKFGQLSAVSVDKYNVIYVFHRGERIWDENTFKLNNRLKNTSLGPISQDTIVLLNETGKVIATFGKDRFYLPHGLTVDSDLNIWVTDVGLHQVMKFLPFGDKENRSEMPKAVFVLGKPLEPGAGINQFCKPASVAIDSTTGDFYVADGYCNSRIIKFDKNAKYLIEWGKQTIFSSFPGRYNLNVPHSLTIDELRKQVIVADRENSRAVFYTFNGKFKKSVALNSRVYGVAYCPIHDVLYAVTGPGVRSFGTGLEFSMSSQNFTASFGNFHNAHDVAVSPDGRTIYVVETQPFTFWTFTVEPDRNTLVNSEESKVRRVNSVENTSWPEDPRLYGSQLVDAVAIGGLEANQIALSIVTVFVILSIVAITCHLKKKRGGALPMERRGLILDDDDA